MFKTTVGKYAKEVKKMLHLKACPRCHGDLHSNRDICGDYEECLQCGLMLDVEKQDDILAVPAGYSRKRARVA